MKRCPRCRRDYYDDSLLYCRDDGSVLLKGLGSGASTVDEPATAILAEGVPPNEAVTRVQLPAKPQPPSTAARAPLGISRKPSVLVSGAVVIVLLVGGIVVYRYSGSRTGQIDSIAVLPFTNETANADLDYLSDGITETLISSLSQLEHLSVRPRSSVFRYKGSGADPKAVGKELAVQAVLTGRVAQRGDEMSFFVELVDIALDKVVWSRQYAGRQAELLSIQRNIATDVSGRLKPRISESDTARVTKTYTTSPEAYQHYLKGNYYRSKWTDEGYKQAIDHYNQAIQIDPGYGLAYTGLALAHLVSVDWFLPPNESAPRVQAAATKALELDGSLADAHVALGLVALWCDWDWPKTEREVKRALELDPNNAAAHQLYGWYYSVLGQTEPAIAEMNKALSLEPLSYGIMGDLAFVLMQAGRVDVGLQVAKRGIELDNSEWWLHLVASLGHERKGQMNEALIEINRARAINNTPIVISYVGYMLAKSGRTSEARQIARELEELSRRQHVSPYYWASVYAGLNDRDAAFALLEKADQQRSGLAGLGTEWIFENLRTDPRFNLYLDRLNLAQLKK